MENIGVVFVDECLYLFGELFGIDGVIVCKRNGCDVVIVFVVFWVFF